MSEQVREMFSSIAPRYDVTNVVLSLGVDRHWRAVAVRESGAAPGVRVLDCATGTGDLALALRRAVEPGGAVVAMDFCAAMLEPARQKAHRAGLDDIRFEVADALALPYPAQAFDVATIAFGIRNVDDPVLCLREMARVVRPGGRRWCSVRTAQRPVGWAVPLLSRASSCRGRGAPRRKPRRLCLPAPAPRQPSPPERASLP